MKIRYIALLAAVAATTATQAQQLDKEIVIARDIVPELSPATRLDIPMTMLRPTVSERTLRYSDHAAGIDYDPYMFTLDAARAGDAIPLSRYRGYVDAGWPGIAAGYTILNSSKVQLGVDATYLHNQYTRDAMTMRTDIVTAHAGLKWTPVQDGTLEADVRYLYANYARNYLPDAGNQHLNAPDVKLRWTQSVNDRVTWHAGVGAGVFNYANPYVSALLNGTLGAPAHETHYTALAGIGYDASRVSHIAVDVDAEILHYNRILTAESPSGDVVMLPNHNRWLTRINPRYEFDNGRFAARVGLHVDLESCNRFEAYFAPDVMAAYNISQRIGVRLDINGGTRANTLSQMFDRTLYAAACLSYVASNIPIDARLTLRVGPFAGAALEAYGGYARANDWATPLYNGTDYLYVPCDLKAWYAGVRATYSWRDIVGVSVSYEGASHGADSGYYAWNDMAKGVLDASVGVTPWKGLRVDAGYGLRHGRRARVLSQGIAVWSDLGNAADLYVGAGYRILDALSVYARVNNLTGSHAQLLPGLPMQGVNFTAGIAYKF